MKQKTKDFDVHDKFATKRAQTFMQEDMVDNNIDQNTRGSSNLTGNRVTVNDKTLTESSFRFSTQNSMH